MHPMIREVNDHQDFLLSLSMEQVVPAVERAYTAMWQQVAADHGGVFGYLSKGRTGDIRVMAQGELTAEYYEKLVKIVHGQLETLLASSAAIDSSFQDHPGIGFSTVRGGLAVPDRAFAFAGFGHYENEVMTMLALNEHRKLDVMEELLPLILRTKNHRALTFYRVGFFG